MELNEITEKIIGCAYTVSNVLGSGFLEKVYENALAVELNKLGLKISQQHEIPVRYENIIVGNYVADLLVEDAVLVELKAIDGLNNAHYAQCLNYLKATGLKTCLLLNFGKSKLGIKRFSN